jgi:hypothetical protein
MVVVKSQRRWLDPRVAVNVDTAWPVLRAGAPAHAHDGGLLDGVVEQKGGDVRVEGAPLPHCHNLPGHCTFSSIDCAVCLGLETCRSA